MDFKKGTNFLKLKLFFNKIIKPAFARFVELSYKVGICVYELFFSFIGAIQLVFLGINLIFKIIIIKIVTVYNQNLSHYFSFVKKVVNKYIIKIKALKKLLQEQVLVIYKTEGFKKACSSLKGIFKSGLVNNKRLIKKFLNLLMPASCGLVLLLVSYYAFNLNYVISVNYNGKNVGIITNENEYDKAKNDMLKQIVYGSVDNIANQKSTFQLAISLTSDTKDTGELTRSLISASGEEIEQGYGLYQNEDFVMATKDKESLESSLNKRLEAYKAGYPDGEVSFLNDLKIIEGLYPVSSVIGSESVEGVVNSNINESVMYVVQYGDTLIGIAKKNNITLDTLLALNPGLTDVIYTGMRVMISNQVPLISVVVTKELVYNEAIPYQTLEIKSSQHIDTYKAVSKEGSDGLMQVFAKVRYVEGREVARQVLSSNVLEAPVNKEVVVGTVASYTSSYSASSANSSVVGTGRLLRPASGYISNGYLGYYGHMAIDIAGSYGTPIYAADDGVVVASGWSNSGYGYYVVINHRNGMQTLYAHNSKNVVSNGQAVKRGQLIANMGRTGNATGIHVHFEVIVNGIKRNPLNYL